MDSHQQRRLNKELHALAEIAGLTIERLAYRGERAIMAVSDTIEDAVPVLRMRRLLRLRRSLKIAGHSLTSIRPLHMGDEVVLNIRLSRKALGD